MQSADLTVAQAAAKMRVSACRVRQLAQAGRLSGARRISTIWLIPAETVRAWRPGKPGRRTQGGSQ